MTDRKQPITLNDVDEAVNVLMEQAQVFASAWSLVGGRFDDGSMLEAAKEAKATLRGLIKALALAAQAQAHNGEPIGTLWQHGETGRTLVVMLDDPRPGEPAGAAWHRVGPVHLNPTAQEIGRASCRERVSSPV